MDHHGHPELPLHRHDFHHKGEPGLPDWCNHLVTSRNRLPPHSIARCLGGEASAATSPEAAALSCKLEEGVRSGEELIHLTPPGTRWPFKWVQRPQEMPRIVKGRGFEAEKWGDVAVPASWEVQGYGEALYTNFQYPFLVDPPVVPDGMNHVGSYQTSITVPSKWVDKRVIIHFEGVSSAFYLWVDGEPVGYSQDSRLPAEFDITDLVKPGGTHTLSLRVFRFCDGSYLEDQDMWWLSGVHRDVILYAKSSKAHIWDVHARPEVQVPSGGASSAPGSLRVDVTVRSHAVGSASEVQGQCSVTASLYGPHMLQPGGTHADPPAQVQKVFSGLELTFPRGGAGGGEGEGKVGGAHAVVASVETSVGPVELWSAEAPWLYTLVVVVNGPDDKVLDVEVARVGFRSVKIQGNKLLINGAAPYIYGVNRHEHDQHTGKYCDYAAMVRDIRLLKQYNFNAVRCSHYPNRQLWYSLCDAYGLYVIDEANIESHGLALETREALLADADDWLDCYMERYERMVLRDRGHACIVVWSLGNEASYGSNHDKVYAWSKENDPTRPVQYESCGGAPATDIICPMYPSVDKLKRLAGIAEQVERNIEIGRTWPRGTHVHTRPVIMCEYAHAMGNSTGNMDEYWDLIRSTDGLQGGFIWDWMDQGLVVKDAKTGGDYWAYGGDCGETVHDGNFNINGLVFPDQTPHPGMEQVKYVHQPVALTGSGWRMQSTNHSNPAAPIENRASVRVSNRYDFSTLSHLHLKWRFEVDGQVVASGVAPLPQCPAGTSCDVLITFKLDPATVQVNKEALLTVGAHLSSDAVWGEAGHEVAWGQIPMPKDAQMNATSEGIPPSVGSAGEKLDVIDSVGADKEELVVVSGKGGLKVAFSKRRGCISLWTVGGRDLLVDKGAEGGATQNFWRCPTDNDMGGIDTVVGTKKAQTWHKSSNNGEKGRVQGPLNFALTWSMFWRDVSYAMRWRMAGLDSLAPRNVKVSWIHAEGGCVVVTCSYTMVGHSREVQDRETGTWKLMTVRGIAAKIKCKSIYTIFPDGEIVVSNDAYVPPSCPPVPRIGVQCMFSGALDNLTYYGRGPKECYWDRKTGYPIGKYEFKVDDMHVPYLFPTENGNRADVQWAALTDKDGFGVVIQPLDGQDTFEVSAHNYTASDIGTAMHSHKIPKRSETIVTVDACQMGLGGTDTWSRAILAKYLVPHGTHSYCIRMRPITSKTDVSRAPPLKFALPSAVEKIAPKYTVSPAPRFASMSAACRDVVYDFMSKVPFKFAEVTVFCTNKVSDNRGIAIAVVVAMAAVAAAYFRLIPSK